VEGGKQRTEEIKRIIGLGDISSANVLKIRGGSTKKRARFYSLR